MGEGKGNVGEYRPQEVEAKWQKRWEENRVFESEAEIEGTEVESSGAKAQPSESAMSEPLEARGKLKLRPPKDKTQDPPSKTEGGAPGPGATGAPAARQEEQPQEPRLKPELQKKPKY